MDYIMYSVKDELTGKFMNPMFIEEGEHADSLAIRQFKSNINNIKLWRDNPNDFSLWKVGAFNDEEGAALSTIEKIISGRSVIDVSIENETW